MKKFTKKCVKLGTVLSATALLASSLLIFGCGGGGGDGDGSKTTGNVITNDNGAVITATNLPNGGNDKNSLFLSSGTLLKDASGNPVVGTLLATVSYSSTAPLPVLAQVDAGNRVVSSLDITITKTVNGQTVKSIVPPLAVIMYVPGVAVGSKVDIFTTNADGTEREDLWEDLTVDANNQVSFTLNHLTVVTAEAPLLTGGTGGSN